MPAAMASVGKAPVIVCVCLQRASFILRRVFFSKTRSLMWNTEYKI